MKPLFVSMILAGMATLWLSAPAQARPQDHDVNARQQHQQQRIGQGVRSGELSRGETRRLEREQRHIRQEKHDGQRGGWHNSASRDPGVNARQHNQRERIQDGWRDGSLTRAERHDLRDEQKAIRAEERMYKSDGVLTRAERQDLHHDQNVASQHIYQERHDAERRF